MDIVLLRPRCPWLSGIFCQYDNKRTCRWYGAWIRWLRFPKMSMKVALEQHREVLLQTIKFWGNIENLSILNVNKSQFSKRSCCWMSLYYLIASQIIITVDIAFHWISPFPLLEPGYSRRMLASFCRKVVDMKIDPSPKTSNDGHGSDSLKRFVILKSLILIRCIFKDLD